MGLGPQGFGLLQYSSGEVTAFWKLGILAGDGSYPLSTTEIVFCQCQGQELAGKV